MKNYYFTKIMVVVLALLLRLPLIYSQNFVTNWLFGEFGIEFKPCTVVVRHDYAIRESRGMGIISDKNGNLLWGLQIIKYLIFR